MRVGPLCTSQNGQCSFPPFAGKLTVIFQTRPVETPDRRHPTGCVSSNLSLSRRLLNQAAAASLQCCLLLCAILLSTQRHFGLMQSSRRSYVHNDTWNNLVIIVSWHVSVLGCFCWALALLRLRPKSPENAATPPGMSGRGHLTEQTTSDTAEGDNLPLIIHSGDRMRLTMTLLRSWPPS